jgi:hypothetical protein
VADPVGETLLPASERLEAAVLEMLHAAADEDLCDELGFRVEPLDGALVSLAANDPAIMRNRVLGLGLARPAWSASSSRCIRPRGRRASIATCARPVSNAIGAG